MRLPAIEFKQHGKPLYFTKLKCSDLNDRENLAPDIYTDANPTGYQRPLTKGRARLFGEFIDNAKNVSPPSVLLAIREKPLFERVKDGHFGYLTIPDGSRLYIVDGQHRIEGVRSLLDEGKEPDFELPAVIICAKLLGEDDASFCEAKQFVVINQTQKRVRADLHDRFLAKLSKDQREELKAAIPTLEAELTAQAIAICDKLNADPDSPWYQAIKTPGLGKRPGLVSQRTFTQSIEKAILKDPVIKEGLADDEVADVLNMWWKAWRDLCPEAFDPATRDDYVLQTQFVPVRVVNWLLQAVLRHFISAKRAPSTATFKAILERLDDGNYAEYWTKAGTASAFRGEGGATDLYDLLIPSLTRTLLRT